MDFNYTETQDMIRDTIGRFLTDRYDFDSRQKMIASDEGRDPAIWQALAQELGLLGAAFSEEHGGFGGGHTENAIMMEEMGRALAVEPYLQTVVLGGGALKATGGAAADAVIPQIISGEAIIAFAYAEPRGRYDFANLETSARKDGSNYVLNGHKAVVIGAPWATHLIVSARTSGAQTDNDGISLFIVEAGAEGVVMREYPTVDGRRAAEVYFENVSVPAEALIGEEGAALPLIELVTDEAIAAQCAEACGAMKVAHMMTVEYSRTRKQFGVPIGSFQVLQHRMVDMFTEYEQSVSMTYLATLKLDAAETERKSAASAAKVRVGQAAHHIGQEAIQIHGGMGMTDELAIGHYFKRLTIFDSEFGNVDHHMKRHIALAKG